eukprot:NODE_9848_length_459_cov_3.834146_g8751_i0.p2 GENE.NODE_9848_length_459_cov_3.834146_g8751_i0~~NODE_9848_length_459_cov_3.834146_g8751_i0.p2  ORF type:complete len:94 (-),score=0.73 NODE_9848_length_459_cov_3.834146_g8751_i0:48-329(-)
MLSASVGARRPIAREQARDRPPLRLWRKACTRRLLTGASPLSGHLPYGQGCTFPGLRPALEGPGVAGQSRGEAPALTRCLRALQPPPTPLFST